MSSTRTRRPVLRSAVLAIAFSGAALGGLATTADAATPPANRCQLNPASCTIRTAPPVVKPDPGLGPDKPVTDKPRPTHPGDNPDKPVVDKPRPTHPGDNPDKPVADKPRTDKPGNPGNDKPGVNVPDQPEQERPQVETSNVDAPVVAAATFTG